MSLIFEALKKGQAPLAVPSAPSVPRQPLAPAAEAPGALPGAAPAAAVPLSGLIMAVLAGMLLAGGGAWLYWAGKASNVSSPVIPSPVALAPVAPTPAVARAPVAVPAAPAPEAAAAIVPARAPVAPATPKFIAAPAPAASVALAAAAAPASKAVAPPEPKPAPRAPINTHVQVNIEPNAFDVRDVFQQFVQLLQAGQLPEAQAAADRISSAMGRNHVMSLRAQGYLALKKDDLPLARSQYFLLHQLLPEDREAGLNLALIEWRQGDRDSASKRVARLLERFPNDQEIQALYLNVRNP